MYKYVHYRCIFIYIFPQWKICLQIIKNNENHWTSGLNLGSLLQCLLAFKMKKLFLISSPDLSCFNVCHLCLILPPCTTVKRLPLSSCSHRASAPALVHPDGHMLNSVHSVTVFPMLGEDVQVWSNKWWVENGNHFLNWLAMLLLIELRMLLAFLAGQGTSLRSSVM